TSRLLVTGQSFLQRTNKVAIFGINTQFTICGSTSLAFLSSHHPVNLVLSESFLAIVITGMLLGLISLLRTSLFFLAVLLDLHILSIQRLAISLICHFNLSPLSLDPIER